MCSKKVLLSTPDLPVALIILLMDINMIALRVEHHCSLLPLPRGNFVSDEYRDTIC